MVSRVRRVSSGGAAHAGKEGGDGDGDAAARPVEQDKVRKDSVARLLAAASGACLAGGMQRRGEGDVPETESKRVQRREGRCQEGLVDAASARNLEQLKLRDGRGGSVEGALRTFEAHTHLP